MKDKIKELKNLTNEITHGWIRDYFDIPLDEDVDYYYIADDIGGIFEFGDMFISFADVLNCYKHNVNKEQFHKWYWWCLDNQYVNTSLAKFIQPIEERAKEDKESLEKSEKRVIFAEELFRNFLDNDKEEN